MSQARTAYNAGLPANLCTIQSSAKFKRRAVSPTLLVSAGGDRTVSGVQKRQVMNIVHYLRRIRLEDGGVVRSMLDICGLLASGGHSVTLLTCDATGVPAEWRASAAMSPHVVPLQSGARTTLLNRSDLSVARAVLRQADAVHLHGMWELCNYQIAEVAYRLAVPFIVSPHGMLDDWPMSLRSMRKQCLLCIAGRRYLRRAAYVHCAASGELEQASRRFGRARGRTVPLIVDLAEFHHLPGPGIARSLLSGFPGSLPVLLFLSRLIENKGVDVLVDAASRLRSEGHEFVLVIAGTGAPEYEAALRAQVKRVGLANHTAFVGHVSGSLKLSLYQAASVFLLPTVHENFGFAILEALACGRPVITTQGALLWRELQESGGVAIVERTPAATAAAVAVMLRDPRILRAMGDSGRRWIFQTFDPAVARRRFEDLYRAARGWPQVKSD
jgi:glycosyltransferase involved in cell wall biosynthesis